MREGTPGVCQDGTRRVVVLCLKGSEVPFVVTTNKTNITQQRAILWFGIIVGVPSLPLFAVLAHFIPPPAPSLSPADIAALFQNRSVLIRAACLCFLIPSVAFVPILYVFTHQLQRIRGLNRVILPYSQLLLGVFGVIAAFISCMLWCAAAFRPNTISPDVLIVVNDIAWFFFLMPVFVIGQCFCVGVAVLSDSSATPVFPRWFGYLSLWAGVCDLPAALIVFFKTGPLAWNGVISFWFVVIVFLVWSVCMLVLIFRAISHEERALAQPDAEGAQLTSGSAVLGAQ
jgi:hypothetical protein